MQLYPAPVPHPPPERWPRPRQMCSYHPPRSEPLDHAGQMRPGAAQSMP